MAENINITEALEESWNIIQDLKPLLFGPDYLGNIWSPIYGGNAPGFSNAILYYFQTPYFNKLQRWQARFLFKTNGYAISAVENLTNLILGEGFQYVTEDEVLQESLDKWMIKVRWHWRERQSLIKTIVDGESFIRKFGYEEPELRWVDPEFVYSNDGVGVHTDPDDYEKVLSYTVNQVEVKADQIQHRKLGWSEEKRGTSVLFPVAQSFVNAESLLQSLVRTSDQLSRFAVIREHDATAQQVEDYRSNISSQQNRQFGPALPAVKNVNHENIEHYEPGSIVDAGKNTKWTFPGQSLNGEAYVSVLRAVLRLCAARCGLPENVLSQDQDSIAAFNGQMVAHAPMVKGLETWQRTIVDWQKELLTMCGWDADKISIVCPEVAMVNRKEHIEQGQFLLDNKLASKQTVAKGFEVDYEQELEIMETEPQDEVQDEELNDNSQDNEEKKDK